MTAQSTTPTRRRWSVDSFQRFWANPDATLVSGVLTEDVVGHWPGIEEPVQGRARYTACIAALITALPGVRLEVAESAHDDEFTSVRWVMYAEGERGPFQLSGIDRVRLRDGLVSENSIVFDTAAFEARAGIPVPWTQV